MFIRILRLLVLTVILAVSAFFLFVTLHLKEISQSGNQAATEKQLIIPDFSGERKTNFSWKYNGANYSIEETLYQSAYDFYSRQPKTYEYFTEALPPDWQEDYFGMFLAPVVNDKTFSRLAEIIKNEGLKRKLKDDQIVELALAFVQAIPYDDEKAKEIITSKDSPAGPSPAYPYETLYGQKGVCSDKSFLAVALLRELGYGAALFEYESANHMAVGVQCPLEYSTNGTGYCFAETTTPGHRIGIISELDENRKALPKKELSYYGEEEDSENISLENPVLYQKSDGKIYQAVAATFQTQKDLEKTEKYLNALRAQLKTAQQQIDALDKELDSLDSKMDDYKDDEEYEKYNNLVPKYNDLAKDYKNLVKQYNEKVSQYNNNVNYYNKLVKEFSILE